MTRPVVIAANWKMHKLREQACAWTRELSEWMEQELGTKADALRVVAAPPLTSIADVVALNPQFDLFAQNVHEEDHGAFTGEVSAAMLRDAGIRGVILGHSERRALFGETDAALALKLRAVIDGGLEPMLCVGETLEQRDGGQAEQVVAEQLRAAVSGIDGASAARSGFSVAYEPVWAIGTGRTATPEIAQEMHAFLRSELDSLFGAVAAAQLPILYGGSVKPDNAAQLLAQPDIDGALVGGAGLEVESFAAIVAAGQQRAVGLAGVVL